MDSLRTDIIIIGGGIAGLWLLNVLRQQGYSVVLIERDALGAGQTIHSQGIIHSGVKYATGNLFSRATQAISQMPEQWNACLTGRGRVDLTTVNILSPCYYLYASANPWQRAKQYIASKLIHSAAQHLTHKQYPNSLRGAPKHSSVYQVAETVLNIPSLLKTLAQPHQQTLLQATVNPGNIVTTNGTHIDHIQLSLPQTTINLQAQHYIFTAGEGNQTLLQNISSAPRMQTRALRMVYLPAPQQANMFTHFLGHKYVPRLSITTHPTTEGKRYWYLGGQLAEQGVTFSSEKQAHKAQQELTNLLPWLGNFAATYHNFLINRAEVQQTNGQRPASCFSQTCGNITVAWPTKLTFAPLLAEQILTTLPPPVHKTAIDLSAYPKPSIATPIWETRL